MKPRVVVITGDFTNGSPKGGVNPKWWPAVLDALAPLKKAGIPVLPVAGNHDAYGWSQLRAYGEAWGDLKAWTPGLVLNTPPLKLGKDGQPELSTGRAPFSYSVDIEGVHFSLAHIVSQRLDPAVAAWLKADLAAARNSKARIVFCHVPLSSVIFRQIQGFYNSFGPMLEEGLFDLAVYGHEHIVWDENVILPKSTVLRQVLVGCSSGFYNFGPSAPSIARAGCTPSKGKGSPLRCKMPNTGGEFELVPVRSKHAKILQHYRNSFTLFTVDDGKVTVTPMSIDAEGHPMPFYLAQGLHRH